MLANFTLTQCVHRCLQESTQDMSLMWISKDLSPVSTNVEVSEIKFHRIFNEWDRIEKLRAFTQQELRKSLTVPMQIGFCGHSNSMFETMGCFYHCCPCQEAGPTLTEKPIQSGTKKREMYEMRKEHIGEKGYTVVEKCSCEWWKLYNLSVDEHLRESQSYERSLRQDQLLEKIKSDALPGYVQCDIKVPEQLRVHFANFPAIWNKRM